MPAKKPTKLTRRQTDRHRASIQTAQLINRLYGNAMGTLKSPLGEPVSMDAGQIASARALLDKALPNLQASEITSIEETPAKADLQAELAEMMGSISQQDMQRLIALMPTDKPQ